MEFWVHHPTFLFEEDALYIERKRMKEKKS